ncbi:hypothetical protein [Natronomonas sp.]|uniref:hypothetical protein n=1 Tax=Natronomonas sp. TaxID=2184060 RepID=UPI00261E80FD|nr:hypothetical protein [Natronomonas sp.]
MDRRDRVDRAAVAVLAALSLSGLVAFRIAMGWRVTDPHLDGTVFEAVPATAWLSVVPASVALGVVAALFLYRVTGVPLPGSRHR